MTTQTDGEFAYAAFCASLGAIGCSADTWADLDNDDRAAWEAAAGAIRARTADNDEIAKRVSVDTLAAYEALATPIVGSTSLLSFAHTGGALYVRFRPGAVYRYDNVPERVAAELAQAASAGKYFAAEIRNAYKSTKVIDA